MSELTIKYFAVYLLAIVWCFHWANGAAVTTKSLASGAATTEATAVRKEVCQGRTPCGWAVYNRLTRYIDYFMKNKCECTKDKKCLRDEDDISITAYIYRCKIDDSKS